MPLAAEAPAETKLADTRRSATQEGLTAENDSLRLLLEQAGIDAKALLAQAGIDAKEREAADKLQKLILEELHHRIKNTLATVTAIASQSLRTATSIEHGQQAIEGRLIALGRAHDLLLQVSWANASLADTVRGAIKPYESQGASAFFDRWARHRDHIRRRDRAGDDVERAVHQHHEVRRAVGAGRARQHRMGDRRASPAAETDLDRSWRPGGQRADAAKLRHPHDGSTWKAVERPSAAWLIRPTGFVYTLDAPLSALTVKVGAAA